MKKFLVSAMVVLALAACSKFNENGNSAVQNGELEQSYVSITLASADMNTRADDGKYEEGLAAERAVKCAYVFFFEDGAAFPVAFNDTTSTSTNSGVSNWLKVELTGSTTGKPNVSDIKDQVLVLQNYKGKYPNQMLAVLNWTPEKASYALSELQTKVASAVNNANGFVMSNSVYANAKNQVVDAVALTEANIGKSAAEALANPVTIHVERVAAKVVYTAKNDGKFDTGKEINGVKVYAQIEAFELYNDYEQSRLLKRINPNWATEDANFGFTNWNDVDWFRSYWAQSLDTAFPNNSFAWATDNTSLGEWNYLGENTRSGEANRTKVIVKATLVKESGSPIEVVNWYGKDYVGEGELKIVVANTLKYTYFYKDGDKFIGLTPEDLACTTRQPGDENAYEVFFQLSEVGAAKSWYEYKNGDYQYIYGTALNGKLAEVQPALVYNDGMTYYWLDIKHLGLEDSTTEYGVVRNHVYKVNITDIKGYGTPVYDKNEAFEEPEKPEDIVTYVSAQINILSWRVVEGNYEI